MQYAGRHTNTALHSSKVHQLTHWSCRVQKSSRSAYGPLHPVAARSYRDSESDPGSTRPYMIDISTNLLTGAAACLTTQERMRLDESPDGNFYDMPRMGPHADENFELAITGLYMQLLQPNSSVLDLCSSYNSYLPQSMDFKPVVGLGMNAEELASNHQLTAYHVQDLNKDPRLSTLQDASFTAALCVNGLQYLTRPERVLAEVLRALQPGGRVIVSFSRYCWESKATSAWLQRDPGQRMELIARLLRHAGFKQIQFVCWDEHTASQHDIQSNSSQASQLAALLQLQDDVPAHLAAISSSKPGTAHDAASQQGDAAGSAGSRVSMSGPAAFGSVAHVTQLPSHNKNRPSNETQTTVQQSGSRDPLYVVTAVKTVEGGSSRQGVPAIPSRESFGTQSTRTPQQVASEYVSPALMEIELIRVFLSNFIICSSSLADNTANQEQVQPETLERWRYAYAAMRHDAQALGIPASVIPRLPDNATAQQIREARDHLERMMASFLSAGL